MESSAFHRLDDDDNSIFIITINDLSQKRGLFLFCLTFVYGQDEDVNDDDNVSPQPPSSSAVSYHRRESLSLFCLSYLRFCLADEDDVYDDDDNDCSASQAFVIRFKSHCIFLCEFHSPLPLSSPLVI